jgi:hypothetical protein
MILMSGLADYSEAQLEAGIASVRLIADPASWINRRVETIEILSHEETRRRVSIDFTLSKKLQEDLETPDGVVVPISVLTKEARRNFDLRDEGGAAVPVLGRQSNGDLAHIAALRAALEALDGKIEPEAFELLEGDLAQIVLSPPEQAETALGFFIGSAESGDSIRSKIWGNDTCRNLLETLWANYVLFAVLSPGGTNRRILKYSYGDDLTRPKWGSLRERLSPSFIGESIWSPNRRYFLVQCPGAWRATSFHLEIAIPEELRIEAATLVDFETEEPISNVDDNVNRASLYVTQSTQRSQEIGALVEIVPERHGRSFQAATTGTVVTALLWLGECSGLDTDNPGSAVSLLLAGAALFSGVTAVRGEHILVKSLFAPSRRGLIAVGLAALVGSATLAMQIPDPDPTEAWTWAAIFSSVFTAKLVWSAIRAPA